jgi:hypothetical protein
MTTLFPGDTMDDPGTGEMYSKCKVAASETAVAIHRAVLIEANQSANRVSVWREAVGDNLIATCLLVCVFSVCLARAKSTRAESTSYHSFVDASIHVTNEMQCREM